MSNGSVQQRLHQDSGEFTHSPLPITHYHPGARFEDGGALGHAQDQRK